MFQDLIKTLTGMEKIIALQKKTANIRNLCILAHVDHGQCLAHPLWQHIKIH